MQKACVHKEEQITQRALNTYPSRVPFRCVAVPILRCTGRGQSLNHVRMLMFTSNKIRSNAGIIYRNINYKKRRNVFPSSVPALLCSNAHLKCIHDAAGERNEEILPAALMVLQVDH